jgi:hypothetical protein
MWYFVKCFTEVEKYTIYLFIPIKAICLLYRTINCEADAKTLQKDLDTMQQWEAEWLMEFNPNKCEVITITNKRSHINYPYNIHGKELVSVV